MANVKKWYAVYTRPRWEKKVNQLLLAKGVETYCPLNKVRRQWGDRIKVVNEPLFKSYVFVRVGDTEKDKVRMTNGVVNFVYWLGQPAIIKSKEIEAIKRFLGSYEYVGTEPVDINTSDRVEITAGAFMDKHGKVLKFSGKKVQILLDCIGYKLVACVERRNLKVLKHHG